MDGPPLPGCQALPSCYPLERFVLGLLCEDPAGDQTSPFLESEGCRDQAQVEKPVEEHQVDPEEMVGRGHPGTHPEAVLLPELNVCPYSARPRVQLPGQPSPAAALSFPQCLRTHA